MSISGSLDNIELTLTQPSPLFEINDAGAIVLKMSAEAYLAAYPNQTERTQTVKAQDTRFETYSGGSAYSDTATVNAVLSEWTVTRDKGEKASATPTDGCAIEDLANEIGLAADEFKEWLTINDQAIYELFDGSTVTGAQLTADSVLAKTTATAIANFAVPNTIYAAWIFDPDKRVNMGWNANIHTLEGLGFHVAIVSNDAKSVFYNGLEELSSFKKLHGVYLVGHRGYDLEAPTQLRFGYSDPSWGPVWNIRYYNAAPKPIIEETSETNFEDDSLAISYALKYKPAALAPRSCYVLQTNADSRNLIANSSAAIYYLDPDIYNFATNITDPLAFDIAVPWNLDNPDPLRPTGGKQQTDLF